MRVRILVDFNPSIFGYLFIQTFIMLFVVLDPLGNVPFFQALTGNMQPQMRRKVARDSILIAASLLLTFAFAGYYILDFLDITISDFMIAGGILLLVTSIRDIISEEPLGIKTTAEPENLSAFPLGTPLLAGPGSITTIMIIVRFNYGFLLAPLTIASNCIIAYIAFRLGERMLKLMGKSGARIIAKVMGILIAAIAVSFIMRGLLEIL